MWLPRRVLESRASTACAWLSLRPGLWTCTRARGARAREVNAIMTGTYVLSVKYFDAYYLKAQKVRPDHR